MTFGDLPAGKYGAILADPPWSFKAWSSKGKDRCPDGKRNGLAEAHYKTMSADDIADLPIEHFAANNCVLFIWITWPNLKEALTVISAWGFEYKTCAFSWIKADPYKLFALEEDVYMGLGYWTRANSEVCLLATRGKPKRQDNSVRQGIIAKRREHSRKPDEQYERIERLVSGPYLELFARNTRPGWDSWGNEVGKFGEVA